MRARATLLVMAGLLAAPMAARADDERAVLNKEGLDLAAAGRWSEALARFRRVVTLRSTPKALFNVARAEEQVGQLVEAARDYEHALADGRSSSEGEVVGPTEQAIAALEPRIPLVTVRLTSASGAARAELDGRPIALGAAVRVDPGEHDVVLHVEGAPDVTRHVRIAEHDRSDVLFQPPSAPASASPHVPARRAGPAIGWPLALGGVGLAAAGVGLALYFGGQSSYDSIAGQCPGGRCTTTAAADQGNGARATMIAGDVLIIAGAVLAAGALTWLLFDVGKRPNVVVGFSGTAASLRVAF